MTCIVGIAEKGKVWVGGDSGSVCGDVVGRDASPKVFRRGGYVIGCCGDARLCDLMCYIFKPPHAPARGDLTGFMVTKFAEGMRKCFKRTGFTRDVEGSEQYEGQIMVGVRGKLFIVDGAFAVSREVEGYDAIGSAGDVARGAMFATPELKPAERVDRALNAAALWVQGISRPFHVEVL